MAKKSKKYYETLGVDEIATREEIKSAYRKKSKKLHPDVGGDAEEFKKLTQAYMVLYDPAMRAEYDKYGEEFDPKDKKKPVDIKAAAESFLARTVFLIIDNNFTNMDKINIKEELENQFKTIVSNAKSKCVNNTNTIRVIKAKIRTVEDRIEQLGNKPDNLLSKILKLKIKHIKAQELAPLEDERRHLTLDLRTIREAKHLLNNKCADDFIPIIQNSNNPYEDWDKSMVFENWGPLGGWDKSN